LLGENAVTLQGSSNLFRQRPLKLEARPRGPDSGSWNAHLWNNVDTGNETDNVPSVATGDFHTEYNSDGKMIGAFGADQQ